MSTLNARPLGFYSPLIKKPHTHFEGSAGRKPYLFVGFMVAYSKCNFQQLQPFQKLVALI